MVNTLINIIKKGNRSAGLKFLIVGAIGVIVNLCTSLLFSEVIFVNLNYLYASVVGILTSISTNFVLNKLWTFNDHDLSYSKTIQQFASYLAISILSILIQLVCTYILIERYSYSYLVALVVAISLSCIANYFLNRKITFRLPLLEDKKSIR